MYYFYLRLGGDGGVVGSDDEACGGMGQKPVICSDSNIYVTHRCTHT